MEVPFPSGELAAAEEERKNLSLRPEGGGETGGGEAASRELKIGRAHV